MPVVQPPVSNLKEAWETFIERGELLSEVPLLVAQAWQRCRQLGVDPERGFCHEVLPPPEYAARLAANADLLEVARPFLTSLYEFVQGSGFAVVLVDREGVVIEVRGDPAILKASASALNFVPGAVWRENTVGNTAIGTALREKIPVQVAGYQHYCRAHHPFACSAAPILGPDGQVWGALNVSGVLEAVHPHTLGMVVAAARAIEGQLAMRQAAEEIKLQHKYQEAIVESMSDGLLTIDRTGHITYMNATGGRILGVDPKKVIGQYIGDIVDFRPVVLSVLETGQGYVDREFMVKTGTGFKHFIKTAVPIRDENGNLTGVVDTFREIKRVRKMVNQMVGATANFTFADILGESREMAECVRLAKIAAQSSSPVLLQGESGTGKELFAQAIHNASNRREGPFVALNCAALPRELIESELFGYEEGAFTGASRGGRPGKFELASGGTIFLDEIGDMPLDMQAKLLRVLQEHRVVRLGGTHYIDCDVRVIAATNKDLAYEVEQGNFRRDLYYRLNVIFIPIPPLRQRGSDLDLLVERLTEKISRKLGHEVHSFSPGALQILRSYPWPGNVRELENVIERAVNMARGKEISAAEVLRFLKHQQAAGPVFSEPLSIEELEKRAIEQALQAVGGNISLAARLLKISRNTLYNKLKKYHIRAG
ncbi:MAG: sigma-54 dependent transcriptional regulator, acetoin dehydrogenase operon transcriptional [Bacillota bacterium]|nr:sigma-54 dependent transcriptional regulator, acetoin dehydrogenase operon transcriptional [Bacillota bacterium]